MIDLVAGDEKIFDVCFCLIDVVRFDFLMSSSSSCSVLFCVMWKPNDERTCWMSNLTTYVRTELFTPY